MKDEMLHELEHGFSKAKAVQLAQLYQQNESAIQAYVHIAGLNLEKTSGRASWVLQEMCKVDHEPMIKHLPALVHLLNHSSIDGVRRNILSTLQDVKIPSDCLGEVSDVCYRLLTSSDETVAVKIYAMQIVANACKEYPELIPELESIIELEMPKNSIAFFARAKRVRKELARLT